MHVETLWECERTVQLHPAVTDAAKWGEVGMMKDSEYKLVQI